MARRYRWLWGLTAVVSALVIFLVLPFSSAAQSDRPDVLRVGVSHFPPGRGHPYSGIFVPGLYAWSAVYDSLTRMTHKGTLEPWLATSWQSTDSLTWRFAPWYCDEEIMPTLVAALEESDLTRRTELTQAVMRRAHEQAQAIFLYEGLGFMGLGPRLDSVTAEIGYILYEEITFTQ